MGYKVQSLFLFVFFGIIGSSFFGSAESKSYNHRVAARSLGENEEFLVSPNQKRLIGGTITDDLKKEDDEQDDENPDPALGAREDPIEKDDTYLYRYGDAELDPNYYEASDVRRQIRQTNNTATSTTTTSSALRTTTTTPASTTTAKSSISGTTTTTSKPQSGNNGTNAPKKPIFSLPPFPAPGLPGFPNFGPKKEDPPSKPGELYLPENYNNLEIPKLNLGKALGLNILSAVPVLLFLNVRNIRDIDETKQEVTVEVDLVVEWIDGEIFDVTKVGRAIAPISKPAAPKPGAPSVGKPTSRPKRQAPPPPNVATTTILPPSRSPPPSNISNTAPPGKPPGKPPGPPIAIKEPPRNVQKTLNPRFLDKIWIPDIYLDNLVKRRQPFLMTKPQTLKFSPTSGFISFISRSAISVSCGMDFHYYPADTQTCELSLRSYSYYSSDLDLSWLRHGVFLVDPSDANFDVQIHSIKESKQVDSFNNLRKLPYDSLQFSISIRRKLSFHLVQTYLPSVFFIIITWLCFLIPSKMAEARIGVAMTTLLTLTAMFASVRESTPVVSYVKAIDIWMVACIFFVFLTLLEFAILLWMNTVADDVEEEKKAVEEARKRRKQEKERNKNKKKSKKGQNQGKENYYRRGSIDIEMSDSESPLPPQPDEDKIEDVKLYRKVSSFVDDFAFLIFSVIFTIFNAIYWSWLLTAAEYFDWNVNATHNSILD